MATTQQPQAIALDPSLKSQKSSQSVVRVRDVANAEDSDSSDGHKSLSSPSFEKLTVVSETMTIVRRELVQKIEDVETSYFEDINLDSYLKFITRERLTRIPHRGSTWDRVLKNAEFFGVQISAYSDSVDHFVFDAQAALQTALGNCRLLIEVVILFPKTVPDANRIPDGSAPAASP